MKKKRKHKTQQKQKEYNIILKEDCHGGAKLAFTIGNVGVWGSAGLAVDKVPEPLLAQISLSYSVTERDVTANVQGQKLFHRALHYYNSIACLPTMSLSWSDQAAPPVPFTFWKHLVADLRAAPAVCNLIINCHGGHGRTGTALICLAHHANLIPEGTDAVLWLRTVYCKEAVESSVQLNYLREQGIFTEVKSEVYKYASAYTWVQCTKCEFFASPQEAKDSTATGGPVVCGHCSGTRNTKSSYSMTNNRYCQICNYSLTAAEEVHSKEVGVDICKPCETKFGIEGAKIDEDKDVPRYVGSLYDAY